jgi:hypothetical protein
MANSTGSSRILKKSASIVLASLRGSTLRRDFSEVGSTGGDFPFAKIHSRDERPTRSAVCTSSPLRSLRPCLGQGASRRARVGRVRSLAFFEHPEGVFSYCATRANHPISCVSQEFFHSLPGKEFIIGWATFIPARRQLVVRTRLGLRHTCRVGEGPFNNAWMEGMLGKTRTVSFDYTAGLGE